MRAWLCLERMVVIRTERIPHSAKDYFESGEYDTGKGNVDQTECSYSSSNGVRDLLAVLKAIAVHTNTDKGAMTGFSAGRA